MLRALVAYYSETGNTEKVAKALGEGIRRTGVETEIRMIDEIAISDIEDYCLICVGTPVHYFNPAKNVLAFLDRLPDLSEKYGVAFSTHGGAGPGRSLTRIEKVLKDRGLTFLGSQTTIAANYHTKRVKHRNRPNKDDLRKFEVFGAKIANHILKDRLQDQT